MGLDVNEDGIWVDSVYVSWDDIHNQVLTTYPKNRLIDVNAVRAIVEELRYLADDIEGEY